MTQRVDVKSGVKEYTTSDDLVMCELYSNTEWDSHAEKVLVDMKAVREMEAQGNAIFTHPELGGGRLSSVRFYDEPAVIFLMPSDESLEDVTNMDIEEQARYALVDGELYRASEDPSDFSENTWQLDGTTVSRYGYATISYYAKHTSEELFYQIFTPTKS